jgi:RNA polymerase sigma factor (sigma-70 family)
VTAVPSDPDDRRPSPPAGGSGSDAPTATATVAAATVDDSPSDTTLDVVMAERRRLLNLAYRMLGSLAEAEDVVQESFARWYAMPARRQAEIENPGSWLTTVASRICLNLLGSARVRRETYVGDWIPEPLPDPVEWGDRPDAIGADPADRVTLDESVSMAFLVILDAMTPSERVAFVLHDVFRYPFAEVAEITGRSAAACRQLATSARRRIRDARPAAAMGDRQAEVVRAFKAAWEARDIGALVGLLDPNATATADSNGLVISFVEPIVGGETIAHAWLEIAKRSSTDDVEFLERTVNGQHGIVALHNGVVVTVMAFDVVDDLIRHIWVVRNPEKLRAWTTS